MLNFYIAQFFGVLVLIANILAMQMKNKKQIIFLLILANLFSAISFLLLESYSGALICGFAIIQTLVNKIYERKESKVPRAIIGIYIFVSIILGGITYTNYIDILPIMCSILYTMILLQEKERNIRKFTLVNITLWVVYDIAIKAYIGSLSDILVVISTLVGIYRFDVLKDKVK